MVDMNDFWTEVEVSVMDADIDSLQSRRDARMARCRHDIRIEEKPDGSRKFTYWRCKDPRCDYCNGIRGLQIRNRVAAAVVSGFDIAVTYYLEKQADKHCKKLGKENYIRIPQGNELDIVFFICDKNNLNKEDTLIDWKFINSFDWKECCRRKTSRIISGNLCKENETEQIGQYEFVGKDIVAGPKDVVDFSYNQTCTEVVMWIQPEDPIQNQKYRDYFVGVLVGKIIANGGKINLIADNKLKSDTLELNFIKVEKDLSPEYPVINPI